MGFRNPARQISKSIPVPPPFKGINAISSLAQMEPDEALYAYNVIATTGGMVVRPGWKEWVTGLNSTSGVRTVIPVRGNASANDKLFACTSDGIFDATASAAATKAVVTGSITGNVLTVSAVTSGVIVVGMMLQGTGIGTGIVVTSFGTGTGGTGTYNVSTTPNVGSETITLFSNMVVSFATPSGNAGWGSFEHCTNAGGDQMLLYCDEVNGYYTYDTATSTWLKVTAGAGGTQINGVDPAGFVHVRLHNNRVWFVNANTGDAYYLPAGQVYGTVTKFSFGNKFAHGGNLNSLWVFTYGSFFGTYLYLVAIGDSGDVIAYTGNDPNQAATWTMSGQWYVGDLVPGRRCASNYGGDLTILSAYGALNLSTLFYQKDLTDPNSFLTKKIAPAIRAEIANNQVRGWEVVSWPGGNSILVLDPNYTNTYQFCYCLATNGWTVFRTVPMQTAAYWHQNLYCGTPDGRVILFSGTQDAIARTGTTGSAIQFGVLGAFNMLEEPGCEKFVDLVRPYFLTTAAVAYNVFARFDFDVTDLTLGSGVGNPGSSVSNGWDSGIWDSTLWAVSGQTSQFAVQGMAGHGHYCAVGLLGACNGGATLLSYDASVRIAKGSFL